MIHKVQNIDKKIELYSNFNNYYKNMLHEFN